MHENGILVIAECRVHCRSADSTRWFLDSKCMQGKEHTTRVDVDLFCIQIQNGTWIRLSHFKLKILNPRDDAYIQHYIQQALHAAVRQHCAKFAWSTRMREVLDLLTTDFISCFTSSPLIAEQETIQIVFLAHHVRKDHQNLTVPCLVSPPTHPLQNLRYIP